MTPTRRPCKYCDANPDAHKKCRHCGEEVPAKRQRYHAIYCSVRCGSRGCPSAYKLQPKVRPSSGTVGAMHELLVAADLLRKGYDVFRSLSPASICDLAILKNKLLIRVEVTTGYARKDHKVAIPKAKESTRGAKFDLLAIVIRNGDNFNDIHYRPEQF